MTNKIFEKEITVKIKMTRSQTNVLRCDECPFYNDFFNEGTWRTDEECKCPENYDLELEFHEAQKRCFERHFKNTNK